MRPKVGRGCVIVESSTRPPGAWPMFDPPQPGDRFLVAERRDPMVVEVCHLGVSENDGSIRYLVRAHDGSRWILVARRADDDAVRWVGAPLTIAE